MNGKNGLFDVEYKVEDGSCKGKAEEMEEFVVERPVVCQAGEP